MRSSLVALTLLAGCGRFGFSLDPDATPTDVGSDATGGGDGTAAAIAIDSTGTDVISGSGVTSISLTTLDVGIGSNECLIASLVLRDQGATNLAIAWNGVAMTQLTSAAPAGGFGTVSIDRLIAPASGTGTLTASWTGVSDAVLGAVSVSGADQTTCATTGATSSGNSSSPSVAVASTPGPLTAAASVTTSSFTAATQASQWMGATGGPATLVQQATHSVTAASSDSCTFTAPPGVGRNLVFVGAATNGILLSVVGGGVTWQVAAQSGVNSNVEIWYGESSTGGGATITYSAAVSGEMFCWVGEFSRLCPSASVDATSHNAGNSGPASPGGAVTANANDLLVVGYTTWQTPNWGVPSQGPWTGLPVPVNATYSQVEFVQSVSATGTWNPSIAESSTTNKRWDAAIAAFKTDVGGIGGASSTALGAVITTHAWTTAASAPWAAASIDILPQSQN